LARHHPLLAKKVGLDVSSSLCVAQFRAGALQTAILTFVIVQNGYTSVLFSCVLRTAVATVRSRPYGASRGIISFDLLMFAIIDPNSLCHGSFPHVANKHHYVGCSDSLGIIPCRRKKGRSRQVSASPNSAPDRSGPLF
jgi:hypothetical protein